MKYRQLDGEKTIKTLRTLENRISERFEDSSLSSVAGELCEVAGESRTKIKWIERPHFGLRAAIVGVILAGLALIGFGIADLMSSADDNIGVADKLGLIDSALNEVILIGAALLFLFSLEVRIKRTRALQVLHDLRAMAHVIDMHQLTKDPSQILNDKVVRTKSSPKRVLTPYLLTRYLDYCSEMLSLIGKIAALYAQSLPDPVVVAAVNDIETLTNGLSRKIWQKIVMLDDVARVISSEKPQTESEQLRSKTRME